MTSTHLHGRRAPHPRSRRGSGGVLILPIIVVVVLILAAVSYIGYVLWPRWPGPAVAIDAPSIPIAVSGVLFNVPPAAIRVPVQRRPGAHERIDLAFMWPALEPPSPRPKPPPPGEATAPVAATVLERVFVTIAAADDALAPKERLQTIYPRYLATEAAAGPEGLAVLAFREGTPYQGEDLIYDAVTPDNFLVRCSRDSAGPTPGICLFQRRIDTADVTVRFPREWLGDWRGVAEKIGRLIASLRPRS